MLTNPKWRKKRSDRYAVISENSRKRTAGRGLENRGNGGAVIGFAWQYFYVRERLEHFTSDMRKYQWLAVRVLLKTLCGEEKKWSIFLPGSHIWQMEVHISGILHTNGYVAVALHPTEEVGIDIERYGVTVPVFLFFVRPDEEKTMNQGDEVYVLLLHWSAKETLFKVMGVEGVDFIRHLHIFPFVMEEEGCLEAQEYRTEEQWHYRVRYLTHPDFVLTWTIKKMPT